MRLFRKTLLFFIGVIVFQSALTIPLITNLVHRINLSEAQLELEGESTILYDSFNSWKRQIWMSLIQHGTGTDLNSLRELLLSTKVDAIVLKDARGRIFAMAQGVPGSFMMTDLEGLSNVKMHPYLELTRIRGTFCLVGVTSIAGPPGAGPSGRAGTCF